MGRKAIYILCFICLWGILAACGQEEETTPEAETAVPTQTPFAATNAPNTPLPTPEIPTATPIPPMATPEPSPTPILPLVTVEDQVLAEDGRLTIQNAQLPQDGWLAIHTQQNGILGDIISFAPLAAGSNDNIELQIDPLHATDTLAITVHADTGTTGIFDFPGDDAPLESEGNAYTATFAITRQFSLPTITISDQTIGEDGVVVVENVHALEAGWLLIHADEDGALGDVLGLTRIEAGDNENVPITIRWREGTTFVHALLVTDNGRINQYDPDEDLPVLVSGAPVATQTKLTYPLDIYIIDQPVLDSKVVIERITSDGGGWVTLHSDVDGEIGLIIGYAYVEDGVDEQVEIELLVNNVTNIMYIKLHEDTNNIGEFDFPDGDLPVRVDERVPVPHAFRTNAGNYLLTGDQPAGETVTIPLIVVEVDSWVVLYGDNAQTEQLGLTWLPAGINRSVEIEVSGAIAGQLVYATLHLDGDTPQAFDYPDGNDIPMQRTGRVIQAPFMLLP